MVSTKVNSTAPEKFLSSSEGNITPANVIAVGAVLPILGAFAVCARFYGRKNISVVFLGADDWLILVSLVIESNYPVAQDSDKKLRS